MRTHAQIRSDMEARPEEVLSLPLIEQVSHPNCLAETWWELVAKYPIQAIRNPLYALLTLESPERWHLSADERIDVVFADLPSQEQGLFAADCLENVLHFYEREHPSDSRLRDAIHLRRLYAKGLASHAEWELVRGTQVREIADGAFQGSAWAVAWAVGRPIPREAAREAARISLNTDVQNAERCWQWQRILWYSGLELN